MLVRYERDWPDGYHEELVLADDGRVTMKHGDVLERLTLTSGQVDQMRAALGAGLPMGDLGDSLVRTVVLANGTSHSPVRPDPGSSVALLELLLTTHSLDGRPCLVRHRCRTRMPSMARLLKRVIGAPMLVVFGWAVVGLLIGHVASYDLVYPDGHVHAEVLAGSGHQWLWLLEPSVLVGRWSWPSLRAGGLPWLLPSCGSIPAAGAHPGRCLPGYRDRRATGARHRPTEIVHQLTDHGLLAGHRHRCRRPGAHGVAGFGGQPTHREWRRGEAPRPQMGVPTRPDLLPPVISRLAAAPLVHANSSRAPPRSLLGSSHLMALGVRIRRTDPVERPLPGQRNKESSFMDHRTMRRRIAGVASTTAVLLAIAIPAAAHVDIVDGGAVVGGGHGTQITFRVPHGCDGAATDTLEVKIPEGVTSVQPKLMAGWTIETETAAVPEHSEAPEASAEPGCPRPRTMRMRQDR